MWDKKPMISRLNERNTFRKSNQQNNIPAKIDKVSTDTGLSSPIKLSKNLIKPNTNRERQ